MAEELNENTAQSDSRAGQMFVNAAAALITITCVLWAIEAQRWFDLTFFPQSVLALILGFSVFIAWLSMRANRTAGGTVPWYDWIGATVGLATLLFISLD